MGNLFNSHSYVPRQALIEQAYSQLMGENPDEGGHYMTVWAPRQRGKSWVTRQRADVVSLTKGAAFFTRRSEFAASEKSEQCG